MLTELKILCLDVLFTLNGCAWNQFMAAFLMDFVFVTCLHPEAGELFQQDQDHALIAFIATVVVIGLFLLHVTQCEWREIQSTLTTLYPWWFFWSYYVFTPLFCLVVSTLTNDVLYRTWITCYIV